VQQLDPQAQVQVDLVGKKVEVESSQAREAIAKVIADEGYAVAA
jgi:copper chaperone